MGTYYRFMAFNVISFSFLTGNIIILYALRLGASNGLVGLIAASYQLTFLFTLIGRRLIRRMGAVRLFGTFWAIRYLLMIPVALTALPLFSSRRALGLAFVVCGAFAFNISKGVGLTAMRPVVGELPPPRERGAFLSSIQLIAQVGSILTGLVMAFFLGEDRGVWRYGVLIGIGIAAGLIAATLILRLPEPEEAAAGFSGDFRHGLRRAFEDPPFRRLTAVNAVIVFVLSLVTAFLIVYFRRLYGFADGTVVFFTVAGNVGAALMAVLSRSVLDRLGPKPLLFTLGSLVVLVLIPIVISPSVTGAWRYAFPALVYFFLVMGQMGSLNAADAYFFSITEASKRLDGGIVFGVSSGLAGAFGGLAGGFLLSWLERLFTDPGSAFAVFFGFAALLMAGAVVAIMRLPDAQSLPIPDALGALVSPRDRRAIRLLNRLTRSRTEGEERSAVEALRDSTSRLPADELIRRVGSPSLAVRMEAISALRNTPLDATATAVLIEEVRRHPYTTAHVAAEILGEAGAREAIPVLRQAMASSDYMLRSKSMLALATLADHQSTGEIEVALRDSENPRVTIYAARALELLGSVGSLGLILSRLDERTEPPVRDQLVLSISGLLRLQEWFYPLYVEYLEDAASALRQLHAQVATGPAADPERAHVVSRLTDAPSEFAEAAKTWFERCPLVIDNTDAGGVLVTSLSAPAGSLERFRFLVAATVCAMTAETTPPLEP